MGGPFFLGIGGPGVVLCEVELHFGEDELVPDLAGWWTNRLPRPTGLALTVAPDWICEALSPTTTKIDRGAKLRIYARAGLFGHDYERDGAQWRQPGVWSEQELSCPAGHVCVGEETVSLYTIAALSSPDSEEPRQWSLRRRFQ